MLSEKLITSIHRRRKIDQTALILSKSRVKEHAEVFTPAHIVSEMLDMVESKAPMRLEQTYLEPSCGTGNFLVQILTRKLALARSDEDIFVAVSSIYGIDIQPDNVLESRLRMLECIEERLGERATLDILQMYAAVLERNIVLGDTLYRGTEQFVFSEQAKAYIQSDNFGVTYRGGMLRLYNNATIEALPSGITCERLCFYRWEGHTPILDYPESDVEDVTEFVTEHTLLERAFEVVAEFGAMNMQAPIEQAPVVTVQAPVVKDESGASISDLLSRKPKKGSAMSFSNF